MLGLSLLRVAGVSSINEDQRRSFQQRLHALDEFRGLMAIDDPMIER